MRTRNLLVLDQLHYSMPAAINYAAATPSLWDRLLSVAEAPLRLSRQPFDGSTAVAYCQKLNRGEGVRWRGALPPYPFCRHPPRSAIMAPPAITDPICPAVFDPMACMI